mgnify:CR=1 FL=1
MRNKKKKMFIGNGSPVNLLYFIELLEKELGIKAIKEFKPMELGDLINISASISSLNDWVVYKP